MASATKEAEGIGGELMISQPCPRCSVQIRGWLINEAGYIHCVSCGAVISDPGMKGTSFKGLLEQYTEARKQHLGVLNEGRE